MTAATQFVHLPAPSHLRPFELRRDLRAVADLVELCFGSRLDADGREYLRQMRAASAAGWMGWASAAVDRVSMPMSGFVWEEDGRLVANLSLLPVHAQGQRGYLIANVATHPDYRRRGIARDLTQAALDHLRRRGIPWCWLQVDEDNPPAQLLYQQMGFAEVARRTTWHSAPSLPVESAPTPSGYKIAPRKSADWPQQRAWLERVYPDQITWHLPLRLNLLQPGLGSALNRFLNDRQVRQWSLRRGAELVAVLAWQSSFRQADWLWLAAAPEHEEAAVLSLLSVARRSLPPRRALAVDYPAGRAVEALGAAGFRAHQTLIWMKRRVTL